MIAGRRLFSSIMAGLAFALCISVAAPAQADEIDRLSTLMQSSSAKTRLAAVTNLARLEDKRALKTLVTALTDASAQVRGIAADALGTLGHKAALPALRTAASTDADADVRKRAKVAAIAVAKASALPHPYPEDVAAAAAVAQQPPKRSRKGGRAGFGNESRVIEDAAPTVELAVLVNSATDESPGKTDKATRKTHADILRQTFADQVKLDPLVATVATRGVRSRQLDLSVTKLTVQTAGRYVEIEAQLRLAISDEKGTMMSFLSGGAKVQVPKATFNARYLPTLRKEALENAMRGMFDKVMRQLKAPTQS